MLFEHITYHLSSFLYHLLPHTMLLEISAAVDFVCSLLASKVSDSALQLFKERLHEALQDRFAGHWNPHTPSNGSAYRCVLTTVDKVDPVVRKAAEDCLTSIATLLPPYLSVWIDPSEVCFLLLFICSRFRSRIASANTGPSAICPCARTARRFSPRSPRRLSPPPSPCHPCRPHRSKGASAFKEARRLTRTTRKHSTTRRCMPHDNTPRCTP